MYADYQEDVELTFKLKDNLPNSFGVGFGDVSNVKTKFMPFKLYMYNRYWLIFYSTDNQDAKMDDVSALNNATVNSVFKLKTENLHKIYLYLDDVLIGYRDTKTSYGLNIRIDDFNVSPLNLEYLKIKPL